jgi:hypothetical protein
MTNANHLFRNEGYPVLIPGSAQEANIMTFLVGGDDESGKIALSFSIKS